MYDFLAMHGGAIKALGKSTLDGKPIGKLGGILCRFSGPDAADTYGDYFDAKTDFGFGQGETIGSAVYFHHALDVKVGGHRIGRATLKMTDEGVAIESIHDLTDPIAAAKYEAGAAGLLGWSSGTAAHLVEREQVAVKDGKPINYIKSWPLGLDASLTPTPAERRNVAVALKSLQEDITKGDEDPEALKARIKMLEGQIKMRSQLAMRQIQMDFIKKSLAKLE